MKSPWLAITALVLVGCGTRDEGPTNRAEAPVAAFNAARAALHRKDLPGYFDALSDEAVRGTLSNSIGICLMSNKPETKGRGYHPSKGCELILKKHGWVEPTGLEPTMMRAAWSKALLEISDPRAMASELERNHRAEGAGSSFVWEYLDPVQVVSVEERGARAVAKVKWAGEDKTVEFERDSSGWRVDPFPELRALSR